VGLVLTAAIGYGTLGVLARLAGEAGISTITFVTWRASLGASFLSLMVALGLGLGLIRSVRLADVPAAHWLQISTVAVLSIVANLAMFAGFERTAIAFVMICFYTYPVMVAVAATRVYDERLTRQRIVALALALAGLGLMVVAPTSGETADVEITGLALGLVAALAQAAYALIAGRGYASLPAAQAAVTVTAISAVGFIAVALLGGAADALAEPFTTAGVWIWLILAATVGMAIPTVAILAGFRRMGPTRASILMLLEPLVAVVLAAVILAERPAPLQLLGGLLVLAGSVLAQLRGQPAQSMPPVPGVA